VVQNKYTSISLLLFLLWAILVLGQAQAQSIQIDSLLLALQKNPQSDTTRTKILTQLCWAYRNSDPKEALKYGKMGLVLANQLKYQKILPLLNTYIGAVYRNVGDYAKGLSYYLEAEKIALQNQDKERLGFALHGIAEFYQREKRFSEAIQKLNAALELFQKIKHPEGLAYCYYGFGQIYDLQANYTQAIEYHSKALEIRQKLPNKSALGNSLMRLGSILQKQGKLSEALVYLNDALALSESMGDFRGQSQDLLQIAKIQLKLHQTSQAIQLTQKSLAIAQRLDFLEQIQDAYQILAETEASQKNFAKAYELQKLYLLYHDSLLNQQTTNQMLFLQASFEDERKTEQIKALEKDNQRKTLLSYSFVGGFLIVLTLLFFLYRNNLQRIKTNQQLLDANVKVAEKNTRLQESHLELTARHEELQKTQEEILTQRTYIESQNYQLNSANRKLQANEEILRKAYQKLEDAHKNIAQKNQLLEETHRQIKSSINSAKIIQEAILPLKNELDTWLIDYFIINRPKDVVSGDFYWVDKVDNTLVLAVADCTGHGVPGAFMTLIANNLLSKIIKTLQITDPAQILSHLYQDVETFLRQKQAGYQNGMDIAIITLQSLDNQMVSLQFAGAKRPIYYAEKGSQDLITLAGTRKSIGSEQNENLEFTNQSVKLPKGSLVYMATDGFADQNDLHRKRLGEAKLKAVISQNLQRPLLEQQMIFERVLDEQLRETTQRDDVLLLGFRV
jgi:serine phosphatase RsbU (regulator of sigma subunit)/tetratricopeptide (TPR) repeat protein